MALSRSLYVPALLLLFFSLIVCNRSSAEPVMPLAPHRAVYDLSLLKGSGAKAPMLARGQIAFDFTGSACEGYVQNFRQITELQPEEGDTRVSELHSATFEAGDGRTYRFKITTKVDNGAVDDIDGSAQKEKDKKISIELARPKRDKRDIAGPILFPTEHLRDILTSARAQEQILEAQVFDGSGDGAKPFDTMTIIGKPIATPANEKSAQIDALKNMRRWPVSISYFEAGKKDGLPAYALSFDLYENGVSRALKLDYGDFVLAGEMSQLTLLPIPKCDK